jgi:hypothetical protein
MIREFIGRVFRSGATRGHAMHSAAPGVLQNGPGLTESTTLPNPLGTCHPSPPTAPGSIPASPHTEQSAPEFQPTLHHLRRIRDFRPVFRVVVFLLGAPCKPFCDNMLHLQRKSEVFSFGVGVSQYSASGVRDGPEHCEHPMARTSRRACKSWLCRHWRGPVFPERFGYQPRTAGNAWQSCGEMCGPSIVCEFPSP